MIKAGGVPGGGLAVLVGTLALAAVGFAWLLAARLLRRRRLDPLLRRYGDAQRRLRRQHLPSREPGETVAEHLARLAGANGEEAGRLAPLAAAVQARLYSA